MVLLPNLFIRAKYNFAPRLISEEFCMDLLQTLFNKNLAWFSPHFILLERSM